MPLAVKKAYLSQEIYTMSASKPERESEQRFFTSLGFLVSVLVIAFSLLLVFSPETRKSPTVAVGDKKSLDAGPGARRQKIRERGTISRNAATPASPNLAPTANAGANKKPEPGSDAGGIQGQTDELAQKLSRAIELIDGGNPKDAQSILEEILKTDPKNEQALVELGMIHLIDYHSASAALPYLEEALKVNGSNKIVLSELVGVYEELGQAAAGLNFLTGLHESQPTNGPLSLGIGQILATQGRDAEAIPYLEAAAESGDADTDFVLQDLADAYSATGNPEKALTTYKRAIDREKLRIQESADKGDAADGDLGEDRLNSLEMDYTQELIRQGRFDEADEILKHVSGRLPNDEGVTALQEQLIKKRGAG
jgi:tetratricopeptide (TPR) repeat protein